MSELEKNIQRAQQYLTDNITKENQQEFINLAVVIGELKGRYQALQYEFDKSNTTPL